MPGSRLRSQFEARWATLALDETVRVGAATSFRHRARHSLATAETVATPTERGPAPSVPDAPQLITLPRISLGGSKQDERGLSAAPSRADLRLLGVLGEGGMGRVHVAEQRSLDRRVAVKTLKEEAGEGAKSALLSEAVITGFLEHPGIIPVHALGVDDAERPILVMKRVEGVSWRELIHDDHAEAWSWETLHEDHLVAHLEIFMQVCNAVSFAHESGVVHRDIKPENVMIGRFGEVYLLDWGVGLRLSDDPERHAAELVGTPGYMAPEMVMGGAVTPAADVYLLGATLHEILTKTLRHRGESLHDLLLAAYESEEVTYAADVPAELAQLAAEATRRDPGARPASAAELRRRVRAFLRHRGSVALSNAAADRLEQLRGVAFTGDASWLTEARLLSSQARFGFTQALEQWPENVAAREGLRATIVAVVEMELARQDATAARAALEELTDPPAALVSEVEALERRREEERAETERLQAIAAEMDPTVSRGQRFATAAIMLIFGLVISFLALRRSESAGLGHADLVRFGVIIMVGALAGVLFFRRALFRNRFNRALSGCFIICAVGIVGHRLALWTFEPGLAAVFTGDLFLLAGVAAMGAVTLLRWMAYTSGCFVLGAVGIVLLPAHAPAIFSVATLSGVATLLIFWRRVQ